MRTFAAKPLIHLDQDHWPCEPLERWLCEFEDGVTLEVTTPRIGLTSLLWGIYHDYPKLPIRSTHYLGNGPVPSKLIEKTMSVMYEDIVTIYRGKGFNKERVWRTLQYAANNVFNQSVKRYKPYMRSVNSFDYHDLFNHPRMVEIRAKMQPNALSIEKAHKEASDFLLSDESLKNHPVISDAKTDIAKMESLLQILVCRGFNTDIDDYIWQKPIMGNYYEGINDPAEAVMDSTLASKAYIYQGAPLEKVEYGNRKLQFSGARVDLLIENDCGSQTYADIQVTPNRSKGLVGMHYLDVKTDKLMVFTKETGKALDGVMLKFRVPLYCGYRDKQCVCTTCYGTLSDNIPYGFNIGIIATVNTQSEVSQRVLKVKHVESLTNHEPLIISVAEKKFIMNDKLSTRLRLNPWVAQNKVKLLIRSEAKDKIINGSRLPVIRKGDLDPGISMARHTQFREIMFEVPLESGKTDRLRVNVSKGSMSSYLTSDFLRWFIDQDIQIDSDGFYRIDVSTWDFEKPFLELPAKHLSMKDFSAETEVFIRSSSDSSAKHLGKLRQLAHYKNLTEGMVDLYDLITTRVDVHMTHVSVVCLSMLVEVGVKNNVNTPALDRPAMYAKYSRILSEGSFTPLAAYQGAQHELSKMEQYLNTNRNPHLMDPLWMPR